MKMRSFSKPGRMDALRSAQTENKLENTKDKLREEIPEAYLLFILQPYRTKAIADEWGRRV